MPWHFKGLTGFFWACSSQRPLADATGINVEKETDPWVAKGLSEKWMTSNAAGKLSCRKKGTASASSQNAVGIRSVATDELFL